MRISEPRELLSYLPYHFGFQPQDSIIALGVRGERNRLGLAMRIDIVDLLHPHEGEFRRAMLRSHLEDDGATALVLVTYTEHRFRPGVSDAGEAPYSEEQLRELLAAFAEDFDDNLPLLSSWVITPDHYFQSDHGEIAPMDTWGESGELTSTAAAVTAVYAGATVAPDREALAHIPRADRKARDRAQRAALRWMDRHKNDGESAWRLESWQLWEEAIASQIARDGGADSENKIDDPLLLGRLQAGLADIRIRDAVMVAALPDTEDLPYRSVATDAREEVAQTVDRVLNPSQAVHPSGEARAIAQLLTQICAHCAAGRGTPALTILAWIAWWQGDGARASILVDRALEADPSYNMARLVERMVELGMPPGWVQRQREMEEVG